MSEQERDMQGDHDERGDENGQDADLAALLRTVGPREQPTPAHTAEVRAAVMAEWRAAVASRQPAKRRSVTPWLAIAASAAALAIAIGFALPQWNSAAGPVAQVARVDGTVEVRRSAASGWQTLQASASVGVSDEIRTSASGHVAIQREDGLELRLDSSTQLAFNDAENASLTSGRVYVDAGMAGSGAGDFIIATPVGEVRHLGTQYSAALNGKVLHVAVREGSVAIEQGRTPVVARAGEAVTLAGDGSVRRSGVPSYGDEWQWAEAVAPGFAIEGRSLDEFLVWAARQTGRKVVYTSADAAREAERTQLKGSVTGLAPEAAVAAVLASEPGLRHVIAGNQIRIERAGR